MATINDIAKIAGVSAATVSHVVNKTRFVSPELVRRVEEAIASVDTPPNFVVRKMKKKAAYKSNMQKYVVFLASDLQNPFQISLEKKIKVYLEASGYALVSLDLSGSINKWELYCAQFLSGDNLAGVIMSADRDDESGKQYLCDLDVPVVNIGNTLRYLSCDRIYSANFEGAYKATVHLVRSGHEQIALFCGDEQTESNVERINGYKKALEDNGVEVENTHVITGLCDEESVYIALRNLLYGEGAPTAIFVANYNNILSVFKFIEMNDIQCPKDLSVVGFNDFEWASMVSPPVTAVAQNTKEISVRAVEMILERIAEASVRETAEEAAVREPWKEIKVPTELRVRGSTCGIGRGPFGEKAALADELQLTDGEIKLCQKSSFTAAISFHYTGKAWMRLHEQGIREVFDALNISLIAITDAHFDSSLQEKQLNSISLLEPDVLIAMPTDNERTAGAFKKVADSKMKLILITNVPQGLTHADYEACVSVNERSHGRCAGRGLGEYMVSQKKKHVALLKYGASFYATNQRDMAAEQILSEEFPELTICAQAFFNTEEEAYDKTLELFRMYPEIEGLYVSWEGPAQYVMSALADLHRSDVAIATADLEYNMALSMAKGGMIKAVSAQCPYEQGKAMALCAANALLGKKIPPFIGIEPFYVDANNLLKSWSKVYKEPAPEQLVEALKFNPSYVEF